MIVESQMIEMVERKCQNPRCSRSFRINADDKINFFCGEGCRESAEKHRTNNHFHAFDRDWAAKVRDRRSKECQGTEKKERMAASGTVVGARPSSFKDAKSNQGTGGTPRNTRKKSAKETRSAEKQVLNSGKKTKQGPGSTTMITEKNTTKSATSGEKTIKSVNLKPSESIMQNTESNKEIVSTKTDSSEIRFEASKDLSTVLETSRRSSVQQLNESSRLLLELAKSVSDGKRDETGAFIQKPQLHEIETMIKCLEGARNIQRTKLDFLKFGHEISKDK